MRTFDNFDNLDQLETTAEIHESEEASQFLGCCLAAVPLKMGCCVLFIVGRIHKKSEDLANQ